jgi:hypothetical protein
MLGEITVGWSDVPSSEKVISPAFLISTFIVLSLKHTFSQCHEQKYDAAHSHQLHEGVVDTCAMRKPKCTARTQVIEEEKFLFL